jgi:hypothetical protein
MNAGIICRNYIPEVYSRSVFPNYIPEVYAGIIFPKCMPQLYFRSVCRNNMFEVYCGSNAEIVCRNCMLDVMREIMTETIYYYFFFSCEKKFYRNKKRMCEMQNRADKVRGASIRPLAECEPNKTFL